MKLSLPFDLRYGSERERKRESSQADFDDRCRTAYDADQPFADLLNTAMVLPIFDGGNVGIRRRHMQELMLSPEYDAWASTYGPSRKIES